jgi:hypothetical protein
MICTYVIAISDNDRCITCLHCGLTSWNEKDVRNHYCSYCREFHDDKEKGSPSPSPSPLLLSENPAQADFFADCLFADWS